MYQKNENPGGGDAGARRSITEIDTSHVSATSVDVNRRGAVVIESGDWPNAWSGPARGRAVDEAARVVEAGRGVFRSWHTQRLIRAAGDRFAPADAAWLKDYLGRHLRFTERGREVDCPDWLLRAVVNRAHDLKVQVVDTTMPPPAGRPA